jgi:hypothetical protein
LRLRGTLLLLLGVYVGASACRQVIGIEDAKVDPNLSRPSTGGSGSMTSLREAAGAEQTSGGTGAMAQAGGEPSAAETAETSEAGASGAGGDGGQASLCAQYCTAVTASCTGAFAVYTSYDTCLKVCAALPAGQPGDRKLNSVQCRLHAALVAQDEVAHYCPIAGPGGNGECGTNCEGLCALRAQVCAEYVSTDVASCLQSCGLLPDVRTYSIDPNVGLYSGPHVECRLYHVSAAAAADPEQHCLHVDGASPCR